MRKLMVASFVSLDGVIESPMTWALPFFDDESKEYAYQKLADVDTFLFGRVSYEMFSARWPEIKGDKYYDRVNGLKKLVASRTLKDVTWNAWLIRGDVAEELARVKNQPGKNIMKYGVSQLDRTLLEHNLVDELNIWVLPICVGSGKRAFEDVDTSRLKLELIDTHRFKNGVVILSYVPRWSPTRADFDR
jgi:dihydrofolate reductase